MIEFWIAVVLMAAVIIATAFRFSKASARAIKLKRESVVNRLDINRADGNLALYNQRLNELDQLLALGDIDLQAHSSLILEARSQLVVDLGHPDTLAPDDDIATWVKSQSNQQTEQGANTSFRYTPLVIALLIPLLALALYLPQGLSVGGSFEIKVAEQLELLQSASDARQRQQRLLSLANLLEQQVSPTRSKLELVQLQAEIYSALEQHVKAAEVYADLLDRDKSSAALTALFAQSLYLRDASLASAGIAAADIMTQQVKDLLTAALRLDPQQYLALSMSGMQAFSESDYSQAISYWRSALSSYGEGSAQAASLNAGIQAAEARLVSSSKSAAGQADNSASNSATTAHIRLRVSIDPSLITANDKPNTPVFVFARAVSGSRMPLAAKRLRLSDLPIELLITENDKMATQSIAGQSELIVGARLARSGQPIAEAGDVKSSELLVSVAATADDAALVDLLINQRH